MTTPHYPGHQRHIKKKIAAHLAVVHETIVKEYRQEQQFRILDIALKKVRGEELWDDQKDVIYHPSFDEAAEAMLWHMPEEKFQDMVDQLGRLYAQNPQLIWDWWIHPRMRAVKMMKAGLHAMISGPTADLDLCWDDQIMRLEESDHWYIVKLKPEEPEQQEANMEPESVAPEVPPKPPVFTPPPVARPWWMALIDKLRR